MASILPVQLMMMSDNQSSIMSWGWRMRECITANTMASAIEAMGMVCHSSSIPAEDPKKHEECIRARAAIRHLLEQDIKPRDIMTRQACENAMV